MILESIWNFKIQILPALLILLLSELPNLIRRLKKFYYVPIYFSVFPLRELNSNLSIYLGEDYFTGYTSSNLTNTEKGKLKKKILIDTVISIFLSAIIIPTVVGFISAFFLDKELLLQSLVLVFLYKLVGIIRAIIGFKKHAISSKKNIFLLTLIYIGYLGVFFQLLYNVFDWTRPLTSTGNYKELFVLLSNLIFNKVIAQGLILTALAAFFGDLITKKSIDEENIGNQIDNNEDAESSE